MPKGNKVFRKVMKGIASTSAAPLTPAEEKRLQDQAKHLKDVKAQGDRERAKLQREEELAEEYKQREAERRRRKTD
jgi:hypothetical protein